MECVQACPLGACTFDDASERVIICDGCEGERLCQKFCPTTVLDRIFAEARV